MTDPNGWPDASKPGVPLYPERNGDHMLAVTDEHGRVWHEVWKWRATSKPQVWLRPNPTGGPYGYEARHLEAPCYAFIRYLGPCLTPQEVAARVAEARAQGEHDALLARPDAETVNTWLAKAEASGRDAGLREAAAEVDCGCAARQDVLARFATDGHKRASYLCPHGDVCCALAAAAIRARIEEAPHD